MVRAGDMVAKVGKWMVGQGERVEDLMDKEEEKSCHSATPKNSNIPGRVDSIIHHVHSHPHNEPGGEGRWHVPHVARHQ